MDQQPTSHHVVNNTVTINAPTAASLGVLERKWLVALLLSIFLGYFGIDQFYLGKTGKGLLKLFTFGLFGILYVIDIIMIATKSVRGVAWIEPHAGAPATIANPQPVATAPAPSPKDPLPPAAPTTPVV